MQVDIRYNYAIAGSWHSPHLLALIIVLLKIWCLPVSREGKALREKKFLFLAGEGASCGWAKMTASDGPPEWSVCSSSHRDTHLITSCHTSCTSSHLSFCDCELESDFAVMIIVVPCDFVFIVVAYNSVAVFSIVTLTFRCEACKSVDYIKRRELSWHHVCLSVMRIGLPQFKIQKGAT